MFTLFVVANLVGALILNAMEAAKQLRAWFSRENQFLPAAFRPLCVMQRASLPGGTLDQLAIALLEHQASLLRVPYTATEEEAQ